MMQTGLILPSVPLVAGLAGCVLLYIPVLFRHKAIEAAMTRLDLAADSIQRQAIIRNAFEDNRVRFLHDGLLALAMVAPRIGGGTLILPRGKPSGEESKAIEEFIENNPWLTPYLTTAACSLQLLRFYGQPWDCRLWLPAVFSRVVLGKFMQGDGGVDFGALRSCAVEAYEMVTTASDAANRGGMLPA